MSDETPTPTPTICKACEGSGLAANGEDMCELCNGFGSERLTPEQVECLRWAASATTKRVWSEKRGHLMRWLADHGFVRLWDGHNSRRPKFGIRPAGRLLLAEIDAREAAERERDGAGG